MNKLFIFFTCLCLAACDLGLGSHYDATTRTMYVDYYQEVCEENSTELCLRIRFDEDDAFAVSTVSMSGFDDVQWGSRYTVQVEVERDGGGKDTHYRFESIESSEVIDARTNSFVLTFNMASGILVDQQNNHWLIAADKAFSCSEADCGLLANSYRDGEKIQLSFSAADNELTLLGVKCQSSVADFTSLCEGVNEAVFDIAHYQSDCGLSEPRLCMVYKEKTDASTEWNILPFAIKDFTPQWGLQYQLDVNVSIQAKDLKSVEYIKENDAEIDRTNESFKMIMRTGASGLAVSSNNVIRYDGIDFDCSRFNQCNDIDNAVERATSEQERYLILKAVVESVVVDSANDVPVIIIEDVLCDASASDFSAECVADYDDVYWID